MTPIVPISTEVRPWGKIQMIGWVGERYYWLVDSLGCVAMMPADLIEKVYFEQNLNE